MNLSIILVNYKCGKLLVQCLQGLVQNTYGISYEIIVVDNSAGDGAEELVANAFPQVQWFPMTYNAGFARANNVGIERAKGDLILLLNADTLVQSNAIGECAQMLLKANDYVAAGVQLYYEDGTPQISGNYVIKGGLNYLMLIPYAGQLIRNLAIAIGITKTNLPKANKHIEEVDWINGAFLMVKKSAIEKAGMLSADFFLYHEESEWCSRLHRFGKLCIYGNLSIVHLEGKSSAQAYHSDTAGYQHLHDKKGLQLLVSLFVRLRKEFGLFWFWVHLLAHTAMLPLGLLASMLHSFSKSNAFKMQMAYTLNILHCWKYAGVISFNKPYFYKVI